ncbi:ATP synthase F(0) complex subunit f, mitochondrial [Paroedura picta]|uniref:ATP synthase F(0) complex subunit f, mitochondrial n=1 Tax=Paroedura picta TaxID=143630 RepID=UPI0040574706
MAAGPSCPPSREPLGAAKVLLSPRIPCEQRRLLPGGGKMADRPVPVKDLRLMDVKLGQLPSWLATGDYSPIGIFNALRRGRQRFLNKYIYVRKGGIGGPAMVITAYVVISYIWSYDHIKHDRWRKYH